MSRKVTKQSIIPVLKFIDGWDKDIHSLNTPGAKYYHFTLDKYNGKNSFTGGFATDISDCYNYNGVPYDEYVINMITKEVTKLQNHNTIA